MNLGIWDAGNEKKLNKLKEQYGGQLPFKNGTRTQAYYLNTGLDDHLNVVLGILEDRGFEIVNVFSEGDSARIWIIFR